MRNDTQISSSESFKQLSPKKLAAKMAEILDVVSMCHRAGLPDLSLSEIQQAYEPVSTTWCAPSGWCAWLRPGPAV